MLGKFAFFFGHFWILFKFTFSKNKIKIDSIKVSSYLDPDQVQNIFMSGQIPTWI